MKHLLIIEDNEAHRELVENCLQQSPAETFAWEFAGSLKEMAEHLRENRPDLMLLDLSLPDSHPMETLPTALGMAKDIPIIVLTSLDDRKTIMSMIQQGAKDCVPKAMMHGLFLERSIQYCLDRERIIQEQKSLERAASFHKLFAKSRIGLVISDAEGFVVESNPAFARWLGYCQDKLKGIAIQELTDEAYWEQSKEVMARVFSGKSKEEVLEKRYRHKDGHLVWGSAIVQKLYWPGYGDCLLGSIYDLTDHKKNEAKVEEALAREKAANKAKSALIAMLGHDIRSPVSNMISLLEVLNEANLDEEDMECVRSISDSGRKLLDLIQDILEFSEVDSGHIQIKKRECDLGKRVKSLFEKFKAPADTKNIQLSCQVTLRREIHIVDIDRIEQIITNMLSNAIKFTQDGGRVLLQVCDAGEFLRFSVEDNGIGIDEKDISNLFKPFSQANDSIKKNYKGTGLGLSICRQLAELMGGTMELSSVLGKGSTFTLSLPQDP